jgi:hypothetical protein
VEDVSHIDDEYLQRWMEDPKDRKPKFPDNDDGDNDDDGHSLDIERISQIDLPTSEASPDSPELFKRIRFLSSWEDRIDSRGPLWLRVGDFFIWDTSSAASILETETRMHVSILRHIEPFHDWIYSATRVPWFRFFIGFIGRNREQSSPVLVLILDSKKARQRCLKVMKRLDWLGKGSRFSVITASPSALGGEEYERKFSRNMKTPGAKGYEMHREVMRRMKMLSY